MKGETDGDRGHGKAWVGRKGRRGIEGKVREGEGGGKGAREGNKVEGVRGRL